MKAAWIAKAIAEGKQQLLLTKAELAEWHLGGGHVNFQTPWSGTVARYADGAIVETHRTLHAQLLAIDPAEWPEGRIPPESPFHNGFCHWLPRRDFELVGDNRWCVNLIAGHPSHALDAWEFDLPILADQLALLQPIAHEIALRSLVRCESKVHLKSLDTPPWSPSRIELAKLGGYPEKSVLGWFAMAQLEGPDTVADVVSAEYQVEHGLLQLIEQQDRGSAKPVSLDLDPQLLPKAEPQYCGMKLTTAGPYSLEVMLRQTLDGDFHLAFLSTMDNSRNPSERRKNFETILSQTAVLKLKLLFDEAAGHPASESPRP